eukprot:TRINITY_DN4741_c0_g3_i2.p1 TRINITY_DN4741_c0_g3~~TRINITY_DN4741_c0_g3_i2.p1  ORF type:complete len:106 (+),score=7.31 TRINITY_DN4741_c0_g3_i2:471-788(+)
MVFSILGRTSPPNKDHTHIILFHIVMSHHFKMDQIILPVKIGSIENSSKISEQRYDNNNNYNNNHGNVGWDCLWRKAARGSEGLRLRTEKIANSTLRNVSKSLIR